MKKGKGEGSIWFWVLLACIVAVQALIKWPLSADQPFSREQFRDWVAAMETLRSGTFPACGPPMASGPGLPGGWYYFLLAQGLRFGEDPLVLSHMVTLLFSAALVVFAWRMKPVFGSVASLAICVLLASHPVVISMTSLYHNPNVAFPFLLIALAGMLSSTVTAPWAFAAGFSTVVAMQCNLPSLVAAGCPALWLLARWKRRRDYRFSFAGWFAGLAAGCLGYLPYLRMQFASGFSHVSEGTKYRGGLHLNIEYQVFKPLMFYIVQPAFEVSSYFGARFIGFIEYFDHFRHPLDVLLFVFTYASFAFMLVVFWKEMACAFERKGRFKVRLGEQFFDHPARALYLFTMATLPFWFLLAGRFDVKYTGLFFGWSYLPLGLYFSRARMLEKAEGRIILALALALIAGLGLHAHHRIYRQRGMDLENPRYSYRNIDLIAKYLGGRDPASADVTFTAGTDDGVEKGLFGLAEKKYGWKGAHESKATSRFLVTPEPVEPGLSVKQGWRLLHYDDGMYFYANF